MNPLLIAAIAAAAIAALILLLNRKPDAEWSKPLAFEDPGWEHGDQQALEKLRQYLEGRADSAIHWYYSRKMTRARFSALYRYMAIVLTGASGLIPIVVSLFDLEKNETLRYHQVGYLCAALAACFVGLDRFSGSSTAWMRFISAAMALESALEQFRMDWQRMRGLAIGQPLTAEARDRFLQRLVDFSAAIRGVIERETNEWVKEFQASLAQLEQQAQSRLKAAAEDVEKRSAALAEQSKVGIVNLTVKNAADTENGYSVFLDNAADPVAQEVTARDYALHGIMPGLHTVRVAAKIKGLKAQASRGIAVEPGKIVELTLELTTSAAAAGA